MSPDRVYYWRVSATNGGGTTPASGGSRAFTTSPDLRVSGDCGLTGWEVLLLLALARRLKPKARR